jgi:Protein of unknown function (DUF2550)
VGGGLALDAAWLFAAFLVLLVVAAASIATRRFLLERRGATLECGLRKGRGSWRLGVASYRPDEFCWFGVFGISMRPDETFSRRDLAVVSRRPPTQAEASILGPGRIVVECQLGEVGASRPATASQSAATSQPADLPEPAGAPGQGGQGGEGRQDQPERAVELALAESALTGLLAWLEAAPPGSHLGVAP